MPELPDVENYRRYLARTSLNRRIDAVEVNNAKVLEGVSATHLARSLRGRRLSDTRRHGKHLLVALDRGGWLAMHFGMTGCLKYFKDLDDDTPHDRLRLDFENGYHLAYDNQRMLGRIRLVDDPEGFAGKHRLGPDALDPELDRQTFATRLASRRSHVKAALMDQSVVAGIGNVYSDEILFHARLHPNHPIGDLTDKQIKALYRAMRHVLKTAIDKGAGTEEVERLVPRSWLLPRRHEDANCPRCGGKVQSVKFSGRTAWLCPRCQPAP